MTILDHLDPFGPSQTRNDILLRSTSAKAYFFHLGQKNHFWLEMVQKDRNDQKLSQFQSRFSETADCVTKSLNHLITLNVCVCLFFKPIFRKFTSVYISSTVLSEAIEIKSGSLTDWISKLVLSSLPAWALPVPYTKITSIDQRYPRIVENGLRNQFWPL